MGITNFLVEGVSGTGKSSVCRELQRRGYQAVDGDRELAYRGDPETGRPLADGEPGSWSAETVHGSHLWRVEKVRSLVADRGEATTFFCGGSRNFPTFVALFDGVFILHVDAETLGRRLGGRPEDEFGGLRAERELIMRLHRTGEDTPLDGTVIDATAPIAHVVDEILRRSGAPQPTSPTAA